MSDEVPNLEAQSFGSADRPTATGKSEGATVDGENLTVSHLTVSGMPQSVLHAMRQTVAFPNVSLWEPAEEGDGPIERPNSSQVTALDSGGRYQLQGELARGGMGAIIKGRDKDLGRDLAIKVLLESRRHQPEVVQRFVEEAQIGGQLQHPGIAPVYELGQFSDGRPFIAMKLVKGKTLSAMLAQRAHFMDDRAKHLGVFEQICQTMAYAHSRGVIHRDLKPSNIMVGAFGEVQVMDWGLAKVLLQGGGTDQPGPSEPAMETSVIETARSVGSMTTGKSSSQTRLGSVLGTTAYMPPEQALGEVDRLDERADVFGLGAILCRILTDKPPYVADEDDRLREMSRNANLEGCLARLDECGADQELLQICRKCLAKNPKDRFVNAGALASQLAEYLQTVQRRLREAEVGRAEQAARADEAQRTALAAEARTQAERRARRLQLSVATIVILFSVGGVILTSIFLQAQSRQTRVVADALETKSNYLYVAHMQMAQQAWQSGSVERVGELLRQHEPQPGEEDRRTFEWFYYDRLCRLVNETPTMDYGDIVVTVTLFPDGRFVAAAGNDGSIEVFDLEIDQRLTRIVGHDQKVVNMQVTPDGRTLVSSDESVTRLWRRRGDAFESLSSGPTSQPLLTRISPDGRFVITPSGERSILLWDLEVDAAGGSPVRVGTDITDLTWLGDSQHFVVASAEDTLKVYDAESNDGPESVLKLDHPVRSLAISDDSLVWATASLDTIGIYRVPDAAEATRMHRLGAPDGAFRFLLPLGAAFAVVTEQSVSLYDFQTGALTGRIPFGVAGQSAGVVASPHGKTLATFGKDNLVAIWDGRTGDAQATIRGHNNIVYGVSIDDDGQVASGGRDMTVRVTQPSASDRALRLTGHSGRIWSVVFSPSGNIVASAGEDSEIILWDANSGRELHRLSEHSESVQFVAFSPTESLLASASRDDTIQLWNTETRERIGECIGHSGDVNSLDFSPDGQRMVSGSDDGTVIVWDVADRKPIARCKVDDGRIWAVAFADQASVAFGGTNRELLTWRYGERTPPETLFAGQHDITSLRLSPDRTTLAMTTGDGAISLFDYPTRSAITHPKGHASDAMFTCFSPDGRTLASGGADGKIQFWSLGVYEPTIRLDAHGNHIHCIAFSPDGTKIASGSWDSTIKIWSSQ